MSPTALVAVMASFPASIFDIQLVFQNNGKDVISNTGKHAGLFPLNDVANSINVVSATVHLNVSPVLSQSRESDHIQLSDGCCLISLTWTHLGRLT